MLRVDLFAAKHGFKATLLFQIPLHQHETMLFRNDGLVLDLFLCGGGRQRKKNQGWKVSEAVVSCEEIYIISTSSTFKLTVTIQTCLAYQITQPIFKLFVKCIHYQIWSQDLLDIKKLQKKKIYLYIAWGWWWISCKSISFICKNPLILILKFISLIAKSVCLILKSRDLSKICKSIFFSKSTKILEPITPTY